MPDWEKCPYSGGYTRRRLEHVIRRIVSSLHGLLLTGALVCWADWALAEPVSTDAAPVPARVNVSLVSGMGAFFMTNTLDEAPPTHAGPVSTYQLEITFRRASGTRIGAAVSYEHAWRRERIDSDGIAFNDESGTAFHYFVIWQVHPFAERGYYYHWGLGLGVLGVSSSAQSGAGLVAVGGRGGVGYDWSLGGLILGIRGQVAIDWGAAIGIGPHGDTSGPESGRHHSLAILGSVGF